MPESTSRGGAEIRPSPADTIPPAVGAPRSDVRLRVLTPDGHPPAEQPKWRKDFPIDVEEDNYVARRDFTKFMVLVSGSFVAGQAWIALKTLGERRTTEPKQIARIDDIPVGGATVFSYPDAHDRCILVRTGVSDFVAYSNKCSHLSCAVVPDVKSGRLLCPCHHGSFELSSGRPLAGPPRRPLPRIVLEIRDGAAFATGVEERTV